MDIDRSKVREILKELVAEILRVQEVWIAGKHLTPIEDAVSQICQLAEVDENYEAYMADEPQTLGNIPRHKRPDMVLGPEYYEPKPADESRLLTDV